MVVEFDWPEDVTLEDVEQFRQDYASEYSLHECAMMIAQICSGSYIITWFIPDSIIERLKAKVPREILKKYCVAKLEIAGACVYRSRKAQKELSIPPWPSTGTGNTASLGATALPVPGATPSLSQPKPSSEEDYLFVEQPSKDFFCPVTFSLLLQPHLTSCCGNHISQEAANRIQRERRACPLCNTHPWTTMFSKHFQRQVKSLHVFCHNDDTGCGWQGELADFNSHVQSCPNGGTTDNENATYSVSVTPESAGEDELQVALANTHVKKSPFKYSVTSVKASSYTGLSAQFFLGTRTYPYDVALTEEGYLAVAELGYHTITLYSTTGQSIHTFGTAGSSGSADGQFHSPSAVAISGDLMYVSEQGNHRVQKFSISKRSFISKFGSYGKENGQFSGPRGISTDPQGKVFVADSGNDRVQVFNIDDTLAYSIPCQRSPCGMAFDHKGHLHVAAYGSHCVHVFTPEGALLTSYGTGTLNRPAGIAIDAGGYIAISEYGGSNRLWIYSPDHTLVCTLFGQFKYGGGIACDRNGSFWVADYGNCRIIKY